MYKQVLTRCVYEVVDGYIGSISWVNMHGFILLNTHYLEFTLYSK